MLNRRLLPLHRQCQALLWRNQVIEIDCVFPSIDLDPIDLSGEFSFLGHRIHSLSVIPSRRRRQKTYCSSKHKGWTLTSRTVNFLDFAQTPQNDASEHRRALVFPQRPSSHFSDGRSAVSSPTTLPRPRVETGSGSQINFAANRS